MGSVLLKLRYVGKTTLLFFHQHDQLMHFLLNQFGCFYLVTMLLKQSLHRHLTMTNIH